jgi:hypothetical protein
MLAFQGALHHCIGPMRPFDEGPAHFAQLYIMGPEAQLAARADNAVHAVRPAVLGDLQDMMLENNTYVQQFRQAMDIPISAAFRLSLGVCGAGGDAADQAEVGPAGWRPCS